MKKKVLSLTLALVMCLGLLPMAALAAETEASSVYSGDGYYITATKYGNQELGKSLPSNYNNYFSDGLIRCGSSGGYGYLDKDGNVVISGEVLDAIGCAKGGGKPFSEGLAFFRSASGGYGYMDKTGKVVLQPEYSASYGWQNAAFHEGLALVKNYRTSYSNPLRYIDQNGNTVLTTTGVTSPSAHSNFDGGKAVYAEIEIVDGKAYNSFYIIDRSGRVLATYNPRKSDGSLSFLSSACCFSEGYGVSFNTNCELHVFDADGKLVWRLEEPLEKLSYSYTAELKNAEFSGVHGGILVYSTGATGEKCKAVEIPSGRSIFPEGKTYSAIYDNFSDGVVTFWDDGRGRGLVDSTGFEVVAPGEFSEITPFNEGLALAIRIEDRERVCYLLEKHEGTWNGSQPQTPAQPEQPTQPTQPTTPVQPVTKTAEPTNDKLYIDGELAVPTAYKIGGSNYFKIRDVAALLNGTDAQFSVDYDNDTQIIYLVTGQSYEKRSSDLAGVPAGNKEAISTNDSTYVNGEKVELTIYKIGGSNYFKLRDLGKALGFNVGYTDGYGAFIETDKPYEA